MINGKRILIIRLGALGDFIQSFYPFEALRYHHRNDTITLLTTKPFVELAEKSPWFDQVIVDSKPGFFDIIGWWQLKKKLQGFDFVYDLQTSRRSAKYFLLAGKPKWSGIAKEASCLHDTPGRNEMHTLDRQKDQLKKADINDFPDPQLAWFSSETLSELLHKPYAVFAVGCSERRVEKRWPIDFYAELTVMCVKKGLIPVIVGSANEIELAQDIIKTCPEAISLVGKTTLSQLGGIMTHAQVAIGNDTGPMHIAAIVGCPSVVLFSSYSNPSLTAPRGKDVKVIYQENLKDLSVKKVAQELNWVH